MQSPTFPEIRLPMLADVPLPRVRRVRLHHPSAPAVADVPGAVRAALDGAERLAALPPGSRVAVGVGSRGIARLPEMVGTVVARLKESGLRPFIVPAMGSHAGASAEGQASLLAHLGVTEEGVGAPVQATMDVVEYGHTPEGIPCCFDANAAAADAVVIIARVKSHTSFDRPVESGLTKMVAVGLGKHRGARNVHVLGVKGYNDVLPGLARIAIAESPLAFGIAVVEDAHKNLVTVEGVAPEDFLAADERLLVRAKSLLARLPFDQIDVLVVESIGKNISGAGMDFAVTGRTDFRGLPNPERPFTYKIGVLGVTEESGGNGLGVGVADYTSRRVANAVDLVSMYTNAITSTSTEKVKIPIVMPDDRDVFRACLATSWRTDPENARLCIIRSTLHLNEILVSPSLYEDVAGTDTVEVLGEAGPIEFDAAGNLLTRC